jgi:hypothetical protein
MNISKSLTQEATIFLQYTSTIHNFQKPAVVVSNDETPNSLSFRFVSATALMSVSV